MTLVFAAELIDHLFHLGLTVDRIAFEVGFLDLILLDYLLTVIVFLVVRFQADIFLAIQLHQLLRDIIYGLIAQFPVVGAKTLVLREVFPGFFLLNLPPHVVLLIVAFRFLVLFQIRLLLSGRFKVKSFENPGEILLLAHTID